MYDKRLREEEREYYRKKQLKENIESVRGFIFAIINHKLYIEPKTIHFHETTK